MLKEIVILVNPDSSNFFSHDTGTCSAMTLSRKHVELPFNERELREHFEVKKQFVDVSTYYGLIEDFGKLDDFLYRIRNFHKPLFGPKAKRFKVEDFLCPRRYREISK